MQRLYLAANVRRIAAFWAREIESNFCRVAKQGAIERHAVAVANACERDIRAHRSGHALPWGLLRIDTGL